MSAAPADERLLLLAEEPGELPTLSALVQDMIVKADEVAFDRRGRRLALLGNRFRHEAAAATRVRCLLRVGSVLRAARRAWPADPDAVLPLLAIVAEDDAITLSFGGGAAIRLVTECVDVALEDVSGPWQASRRPDHGSD